MSTCEACGGKRVTHAGNYGHATALCHACQGTGEAPPFEQGDRICLVKMVEDFDPIPPGTTGTVRCATWVAMGGRPYWQVDVKWDIARPLSLVIPPDRAVKVKVVPS